MSRIASGWLTSSLLVLAAGCGSGPSSPTPASYAGQWTGTTSQGTPISFTVSSDQKLTALAIGYGFNGCSGSATFLPNAALESIPTAPTPVYTAHYESGPVDSPNRMLVTFLFTSTTTANGMVIFVGFEGCGTGPATAPWTATKH